jgi:para-nitrobenzyl esterase
LLDQVAALRWVRAEIEAFGGNPRNVTVFGQSAGGFDIAELMAMPAAEGCFDAAIPMSGSLSPHVTAEQGSAAFRHFVEKFGGEDKLRAVAAADVLAFQAELTRGQLGGAVRFGPTQDGTVIREDASRPIGRGDHTRGIPLLIGHTAAEYGLWTGMDPSMASLDEEGLVRLAGRLFGARAAEAVGIYRAARGRRGELVTRAAIWTAMMTDSMFRIPAIRTAELHSRHTADTWMYRFDYASPAYDGKLGACHSLDIPFIWGTVGAENMARFCGTGPAVDALSDVMIETYLAFAKTRDPASAKLPAWPRYTPTARATMQLGTTCSVVHAPQDEEREFWAFNIGV